MAPVPTESATPPHRRCNERNEPSIHRYRDADRTGVRSLCCDTADSGEPVERFFPDREVFADLVTRYYTDIDPDSSWVVKSEGLVVGYLNGCLDTRRFGRTMAIRILPRLAGKSILRGTWFRPQARRFITLNTPLWIHHTSGSKNDEDHYPAHFHINLAPGHRARQIGTTLVERFLTVLQESHIPGVHANVREDNERACAFFTRLGFTEISRHPFMRRPEQPENILYSLRYGRRL